jgi:hypothetical protein
MSDLKTTGYNADTAKNLLLDAGAVYKNFDTTTMVGTLLGATQGGNSFEFKPNFRNIPIDGIKSEDVKGLSVIDSWTVTLTTNLLEITKDSLSLALAGSTVLTHDENYDSIKAKNAVTLTDYIDNVTFVGRLSGSDKPVIVIVKNALNKEGLSVTLADSSEGKLPITFVGHVAPDDMETPPFEILFPKTVA